MITATARDTRMLARLPFLVAELEALLRCNECKVCARHRYASNQELIEDRKASQWRSTDGETEATPLCCGCESHEATQ